MQRCHCGNESEFMGRYNCEQYCRLGFHSRDAFLVELIGNLFDKITCRECGADVSNKERHARWHLRLDKHINNEFAEAWTIHFKTLTEL